ncbi:MAG: hypothetical protein ACREGG_03985 [Candidatus Saccharimonadales bacterium]
MSIEHLESLAHPSAQEYEHSEEIERKVAGFRTAKGSIYTYGPEGKTTRFKTAAGEQQERQDITVFSPLTIEEEQDYLLAYRSEDRDGKTKVYVVERQPDDSARIVRDVTEVKDPDRVYLTIVKDGQIVKNNKAFLQPVVGYSVFDTRHFQENGQPMTERHLGNKVTEIIYDSPIDDRGNTENEIHDSAEPEPQSSEFYYPAFKSEEYEPAENEDKNIKIWNKEGFDLQQEILATSGPVLEIGGPTLVGYHFLDGVKLPSKPLITNSTKEWLPEDMRPYVEQILDGRHLPFEDATQGIALMKALNIAESTPETINTMESDREFEVAEKEMDEIALGTLDFKDVKYSLRAQVYPEIWRTLSSGGLFFTDGSLSDAKALQRLGFEIVAYKQEYMKPPEGIAGFQGITYELVLRKP